MYHALHNGRGAYKQGGLSAAQDPPSLELRFTHELPPADRVQNIAKGTTDPGVACFDQ